MTTLETLSGTATDPAPTDSGIIIVQLRVRRNSDGKWWDFVAQDWADVAVSTTVSGAGIWSYAVPETLRANLASGTSYFLAVRAQDGSIPGNVGDFSEGSGLTCLDAVGPGAVTNLSALTGGSPGTIQLSWTAPGDDGGSGLLLLGEYRVNYSTDPAASFSTAAAQVVLATASVRPGDAQSLSVSGLVPNATYYLRAFRDAFTARVRPERQGLTAQQVLAELRAQSLEAEQHREDAQRACGQGGADLSLDRSDEEDDGEQRRDEPRRREQAREGLHGRRGRLRAQHGERDPDGPVDRELGDVERRDAEHPDGGPGDRAAHGQRPIPVGGLPHPGEPDRRAGRDVPRELHGHADVPRDGL